MLAQAVQDNTTYGYFPTKRWICGVGQHCTVSFLWNVLSDVFRQQWLNNIPMQYCPSMIDTILHRLFSS